MSNPQVSRGTPTSETKWQSASTSTLATAAQCDQWWKELRGRHRAKSAQAREELITHYAPLVNRIAHTLIGKLPDQVEFGDLVSYGYMGLLDAVERFEPERGFKFETYAATRVRGAIIDELRAQDWVPRSVRSRARSVEKARHDLEQKLQRTVTDDDIADVLEWNISEVRTVRAQVSLSRFAALDGGDGTENSHVHERSAASLCAPSAAEPLESRATSELLGEAISQMRERYRDVLRLYYFEGLTLAQIGHVLGVTESRVSQIHTQAVRELREHLSTVDAFS